MHGFAIRLLPQLERAASQTAIFELKITQVGKCRGKGELIPIAGIDAGHQRLDQILVRFPSEPSADKRTQRFISVDGFRGLDKIQSHACFSKPGDKLRFEDRPHIRGDHHGKTIWQRFEFVVVQNVCVLLLRICAMQSIAEPELFAECSGVRLGCQEGVGTAFDNELTLLDGYAVGRDLAAPTGP